MSEKKYWLMKSEPTVYSIQDLKRDKKTCWEGVRNYQARNFMRDQMNLGDEVIFYHSNSNPSGAAGIAKVCKKAYPDKDQFNPNSKYFDPKSNPDKPRWIMVDLQFVKTFPNVIPLQAIKENPKLKGILVAQKGSRLSVQPISQKHFELLCQMAQ